MTMLLEGERGLRDMRCGRARTLLLAIVLAAVAAAPVFAFQGAAPKRVPLSSGWIDARHGWSGDDTGARWSDDGGRTWRDVMGLGRFQLPAVRTSSTAAISGFVTGGFGSPGVRDRLWTNDAGKHWYLDGPPMSGEVDFAGRGSLLFWHDNGDTLHRVEGWPPRGVYPCDEVEPGDLGEFTSGKLCRNPADHGMRSVMVAALDRGAFGVMRLLPDGVVTLVRDSPTETSRVAVYRHGSLSLEELPRPHLMAEDERANPSELAVDWPGLYALSDLWVDTSIRRIVTGAVLWRSANGAKTWTVTVARALPSRAYRVHGRARIVSRTWLPGGYVATARVGARLALVIRQLDRTRPMLALPGSAKCSALELRVDWPNIIVEGRRGGSTRAIWLSQDGGYRWTRFAVHRRTRSGSC